MITCDPIINIYRIASRVSSGGHPVPKDKIISRYDKSLELIQDVLKVCDICHIYDNSGEIPFRILKKKKNSYYYDELDYWDIEDIKALTGITKIQKRNLNSKHV